MNILITDVETTDLVENGGVPVEAGLIIYNHELDEILEMYNGLEDPGAAEMNPEAQAIHGIKPASLIGQSFDEQVIRRMAGDAEIIIAHNSVFDMAMLRQRFAGPEFAKAKWADSKTMINWRSLGFKCRNLTHLAADAGIPVVNAHRTLFDCYILLEVLRPYMDQIIRAHQHARYYTLHVLNNPRKSNGMMKKLGYWAHWDRSGPKDQFRYWFKELMVADEELEVEKEKLRTHVFPMPVEVDNRNNVWVEAYDHWSDLPSNQPREAQV